MSEKSFLLKFPDSEDAEHNAPNFAYMSIGSRNEESLIKIRDHLAESGWNEIKKYNYRLPSFVRNTQDNGIENVEYCPVYSCNLVVAADNFWLEVMHDKYSTEVRLDRITFRELKERPSDRDALKVPITFVAERTSGELIKVECLMNPYDGALDNEAVNSGIFDATLNGDIKKTYVVSESGEEYRLFHDQSTDRYWVSPYDLESLLETINSELPSPC